MSKLWAKKGSKINTIIEAYTVNEDYLLDNQLMPYDIQATKAHAKGLESIGILTKEELKKIISRLGALEKLWKSGKVKIKVTDEDCHTVIENFLSGKLRTTGKKIHTGRSRNDQVLTAIRLYMKDNLKKIKKEAKKVAKHFLEFAIEHQNVPMPGYTHTQQAMLSSVGHYFCAYFESLIDDISFLDAVHSQIDSNPLGSAAGYGTSLLLDRELTTKELKFKNIQINSLYCQNSRGKFESLYLEALSQIMFSLSRFANDLILFTSQEFDFFKVKNTLVTGSSIMPQKRNLDGMEILRGKTHIVTSNQSLIKDICKNLISGYHRDLQLIKKPLFESTEIVLQSLDIADLYLKGIKPKEKSIAKKISHEIYMADLATDLAKQKKIPFRTAYKQAHKKIAKYKPDPKENIKSKISLGAPGNLDIHYYKSRLRKI
ncbi:MAG: argininosuccinate lyase [bacterium]|nr:argininosuccinate lyase [bacterium]